MARAIAVSLHGEVSSFGFSRVSREALYGKRQRVAVDSDGQPCERAQLMRDGSTIVRSGMTSQGYVDGSSMPVARADLVGLDADGSIVERQPSTLGAVQELTPATPADLLDVQTTAVYLLDETEADPALLQSLRGGAVYRFPFRYSPGFGAQVAHIVANDAGLFALVGEPAALVWLEPTTSTTTVDLDLDDDLDFEIL